MRALIQRVSEAGVEVDGEVVGRIGPGLLVLLGIGATDAQADVAPMAGKIANMRIFPDQQGRFNRSLLDTGGAALLVSQFTLYADTRKGRRPSFVHAAPPELPPRWSSRSPRRCAGWACRSSSDASAPKCGSRWSTMGR